MTRRLARRFADWLGWLLIGLGGRCLRAPHLAAHTAEVWLPCAICHRWEPWPDVRIDPAGLALLCADCAADLLHPTR